MDLCFQSWAWINKGTTPVHLAEARRLFERAVALDPANVEGLIGVALVDILAAVIFLPDDRAARFAFAEAVINDALSLAPHHAFGHLCMGIVQMNSNRASLGIAECERALGVGLGPKSGCHTRSHRHCQDVSR